MICSKCGNQVADGAAFCNKCGNKLDVAAPQALPSKKNKIVIAASICAGLVVIGGISTALLLSKSPKSEAPAEPETGASSYSSAPVSSQAEEESLYDKVNALLDKGELDGALALLDDNRKLVNTPELSEEARCILLTHLGNRHENASDYEKAYLCFADVYQIDTQYGDTAKILGGYSTAGWYAGKTVSDVDLERIIFFSNSLGQTVSLNDMYSGILLGSQFYKSGFSSWHDLSEGAMMIMSEISSNDNDYGSSYNDYLRRVKRMFGPDAWFAEGEAEGMRYDSATHSYNWGGHGGPSQFYGYYLDSAVDVGDRVYATMYLTFEDWSAAWGAIDSYPIYYSKESGTRPFLTIMSDQLPTYDAFTDHIKTNGYYIGMLKPYQADLRMCVLEMKRHDDGTLYMASMEVFDGDEFILMSQGTNPVDDADGDLIDDAFETLLYYYLNYLDAINEQNAEYLIYATPAQAKRLEERIFGVNKNDIFTFNQIIVDLDTVNIETRNTTVNASFYAAFQYSHKSRKGNGKLESGANIQLVEMIYDEKSQEWLIDNTEVVKGIELGPNQLILK